jgi:hypothetical protein
MKSLESKHKSLLLLQSSLWREISSLRAMNLNPSELSKEEDATPVHVLMNIDEHTMNSWLLLINDLTIHPQRNGQLNGSNKNRRKIKINAHDDNDRRAKRRRKKRIQNAKELPELQRLLCKMPKDV